MPKAILEFNLPEEQDEFDNAVSSSRIKNSVWDFDQWMRTNIKHETDSSLNFETLEVVRNKLHEFLADYNVQL